MTVHAVSAQYTQHTSRGLDLRVELRDWVKNRQPHQQSASYTTIPHFHQKETSSSQHRTPAFYSELGLRERKPKPAPRFQPIIHHNAQHLESVAAALLGTAQNPIPSSLFYLLYRHGAKTRHTGHSHQRQGNESRASTARHRRWLRSFVLIACATPIVGRARQIRVSLARLDGQWRCASAQLTLPKPRATSHNLAKPFFASLLANPLPLATPRYFTSDWA